MKILSKEYLKAVDYYQKAMSLYPKDESEKGDYLYHLGEAQYLNGDKKPVY